MEKSYKTEKLKLKGRKLPILEKKSETEINLLKIKELTIQMIVDTISMTTVFVIWVNS